MNVRSEVNLKPQVCKLGLCLGISLLVLLGCIPIANNSGIHVSETTTTSSLQSTATTNSVESTIPSSPIPTGTPVNISTLSLGDAYLSLQKLIQGGQSCLLPCWGGIIPGVTSTSDASVKLQTLFQVATGGPPLYYKGQQFLTAGGGRSFLLDDAEINLVLGWLYHPDRETVEMVQVEAFAFQKLKDTKEYLYGSQSYKQLFEEYGIQKVLSSYGRPSKVLTFAYVYGYGNSNPYPNPEEFQILLLYNKGIFINYMMPLKRIGNDNGEACPADAFFDMWLIPTGSSDFYQEMWSSSVTGSPDFSSRLKVEESTQFTEDSFYQTFRASTNTCVETPLGIWPQH